MEYEKIINLLDDTTSQPFEFRTRNWVVMNDWAVIYNDYDNDDDDDDNNNNNIKFKTTMLLSSLCYYSYAHMLVKRTITVTIGSRCNFK